MAELLVTRRMFGEALELLRDAGHRVDLNDSARILSPGELKERLAGKAGMICMLNDRVDAGLMAAAPSLKVVANVAVGYDNIDAAAASVRGIMVTNTPGVLTETTADMTFALLLACARRVAEADRSIREGVFPAWEPMQPHMGVDVFGKTLGIVGLGRIGSAVARRARRGFDMRVLYHNEPRLPVLERELGVEYAALDDLLRQSDFVSLHVPLGPETRHLISGRQFGLMKREAILVNTSRGPVVDEGALADALRRKTIRGAALDVFEEEPKVHPGLLELRESVVLAPHIASASVETRTKMARMAAENVIEALAGRRPPNLVNPEVFNGE